MARAARVLRLFVAVYPPTDVAASLLDRVRSLELPSNRLVAPQQVHLTLQFIGDVNVRQLDDTIESVQRSAAGIAAFELQTKHLITLPQRGAARLVAAQTDSPVAMMQMQRRLAQRLSHKPRRNSGDRFLPHMMLARFRTPSKVNLSGMEASLRLAAIVVRSFVLMRSTLQHSGAVHEVVHEIALD